MRPIVCPAFGEKFENNYVVSFFSLRSQWNDVGRYELEPMSGQTLHRDYYPLL